MKRLIVNSDDYGRSSNISKGIREAHIGGIVTSTTCMMNFPTTADDIRTALKVAPKLGLGTHLVLTAGKPLTDPAKIKSLVTAEGGFRGLADLTEHIADLDPTEAQTEWRAQIEAFVSAAGNNPTHLDSHHHSSYFSARLFRAMLELAKEYGCGIRLPRSYGVEDGMEGLPPVVRGSINSYAPKLIEEFDPPRPDSFFASFYDENATKEHILDVLKKLPEGDYELMCHPGYTDTDLALSSVYNAQRERELSILTDPDVLEAVKAGEIQLITFADL
jgi:predicted glycoside hydrolase/deacetylase ChbG (UPF0249 family)